MSSSPDIAIREAEGRFSRFELIRWWDQPRLRAARVLVIGAGALGNELVKNCALLGIGNLFVADMDRIEDSNLSRSVLFREADRDRHKAEVACEAARDIYPDGQARPFVGNIVHDLGRGVYFWADVILGGLDNREARVAMNRGAALAGKAWIDGAIEVLDGVARVFDPAQGPCYECTMSDVDWQILESRRSCALLTREEMTLGRTPTTPTTAAIVAGIEVQEAVKMLHGLETLAGGGLRYMGAAGEVQPVRYGRKADCFGHQRAAEPVPLGVGVADLTVAKLLERARDRLGPEAVLELGRDIVEALVCPECGRRDEVYRSFGQLTESDGVCPACDALRAPETLLAIGSDAPVLDRTFAELGVPPLDIISAREDEREIWYLFDGDADTVLGNLSHEGPWTGGCRHTNGGEMP